MICYKGAILTCDANDMVASFLVEEKGRILYVGDVLPEKYRGGKLVALGKQALVPAFVDTHQHFASFATFHAGLNVMEAGSNREIAAMVGEFAEKSRAKTLIAFGASPYSVREGRLICREELDAVCPDKALMVVKYDGHACIVNTKLLNSLKAKISGLRGYHADTGEMNQEAFFAVSDAITSSLSIFELVKNMQKAMDYEASHGIGMVHSVSGVGFPMDLDISMEQWVAGSAQNGFQLRIFPQSMKIETATKRGLPRIGGCFACALDGCFGSRDAALKQPYENSDSQGVLYYSDAEVTKFCIEANRAGLQIEMHAIGDAAFEQATRALKAALEDTPRKDHRHGIIHACMPTAEGLDLCREYHIQLPMQSAFINWKQEPDAYLASILGQRAEQLNPLKTIWDMGISISAGSDGPCTDPDPIAWMEKACNPSNPAQALTPKQALRMCTYNGAYASFDETARGSLETGKIADMALLSENLFEIPKEEIGRVRVNGLILQGKRYEPQQQNVAAAILRGIMAKK